MSRDTETLVLLLRSSAIIGTLINECYRCNGSASARVSDHLMDAAALVAADCLQAVTDGLEGVK